MRCTVIVGVIVAGLLTASILAGANGLREPVTRPVPEADLPQDCCKLADSFFVARQQYVEESADSAGTAANGRGAYGENSAQQNHVNEHPAIQDATTTAILTAVEQQLNRYFGAMGARADAVQQAGDRGRAGIGPHLP